MSSTNRVRVGGLGTRVELVSMDRQFRNISIGLYQETREGRSSFLVHTYSQQPGTSDRTVYVASVMAVLGGLEIDHTNPALVRFPCGEEHRLACRRIFLEATKLPNGSPAEAKLLEVFDRKTENTVEVVSEGAGTYQLRLRTATDAHQPRVAIAALGLAKLGGMAAVGDTNDQIRFDCGMSHDQAVGLLLGRALDVRAAVREIEDQANRGVLAAPSTQST